MKKAFLIIAILSVGFATAQNIRGQQNENRKEMRQKMMAMSAEQMADLKTKKLALALDLDSKQQQEVKKIQTQTIQNHKNMMKDKKDRADLTTEQIYKMKSDRLDAKIKTKQEMKRILNEEQYQTWVKMSRKRHIARKSTAKQHINRS